MGSSTLDTLLSVRVVNKENDTVGLLFSVELVVVAASIGEGCDPAVTFLIPSLICTTDSAQVTSSRAKFLFVFLCLLPTS